MILIFGIEKELVVYVTIIFIPEYLISAVIQWYLSRLTATRILEYEAGLFRSMRVSGKIIKEWKAPSFPRIRAIRIPFSSYGVIVLNRGFLGLWMSPAVPHKELADAIAILIETMDADK